MARIISVVIQSSVIMPNPGAKLLNMEELAEMLLKASKTNAEKGGDSLVVKFRTEGGLTINITEGEGLYLCVEE